VLRCRALSTSCLSFLHLSFPKSSDGSGARTLFRKRRPTFHAKLNVTATSGWRNDIFFFVGRVRRKKGFQPRRDREAKKHVLLGNQTFSWAHLPETQITYTCETETSLGGKNMKGTSFIAPLARPSLGLPALGLPE